MNSILLTGSKSHGKTTVAHMLREDFGYVPLSLADGVRREVAEMLASQMYPNGTDEWYAEREHLFYALKEQGRIKDLLRGLLQYHGTELRRQHDPLYWVKLMQATIRGYIHLDSFFGSPGLFVIDDVSFQNELDAWPDWFHVRVYNPHKPVNIGEHESERGRAELPVQYTLVNDGSLADLREKVGELMEGMLSAQAAGGV